MKVLDLFSGIGGFSLGLERAGFETVAFCEIEEYPRKVLAKHWPDVPIYDDVRTLTHDRLRQDGISDIDVLCGGFPCQDISVAGNQAGMEDGTRSGLWSECARLLGEIRPKYAIFENVTALLSGNSGGWFQRVLWDISQVGYDAEWHCIPASELGAHHHRDRVWIIAYPQRLRPNELQTEARLAIREESLRDGSPGGAGILANSMRHNVERQQHRGINPAGRKKPREGQIGSCCNGQGWWETEPGVGRVADGVPRRTNRLKALGNAVVPQIPEIIGNAIMLEEETRKGIEILVDTNCAK